MKNQRYLLQHVIFTYVCTTEQHMAKLFKRGQKKCILTPNGKLIRKKYAQIIIVNLQFSETNGLFLFFYHLIASELLEKFNTLENRSLSQN